MGDNRHTPETVEEASIECYLETISFNRANNIELGFENKLEFQNAIQNAFVAGSEWQKVRAVNSHEELISLLNRTKQLVNPLSDLYRKIEEALSKAEQ